MSKKSQRTDNQYPIYITTISSFIAGGVSRSLVYPIDTIKTKLQVQQGNRKPEFLTITGAFKTTISNPSSRRISARFCPPNSSELYSATSRRLSSILSRWSMTLSSHHVKGTSPEALVQFGHCFAGIKPGEFPLF